MSHYASRDILKYLLLAGGRANFKDLPHHLPFSILKSYLASNGKLNKSKLNQTIKRFVSQKLVLLQGDTVFLTDLGRQKALFGKAADVKLTKPEKWDGKWRIVSLGIPQEKHSAKMQFIKVIENLNFHKLQKNLFTHPHPCQYEIDLLRKLFDITPYVRHFVTEEIEEAEMLKAKYNL